MIVSEEAVRELIKHARENKQPMVFFDKGLAVGLLTELLSLQAALAPIDKKKLDLVQEVTFNYAVGFLTDILHGMIERDWGDLTPNDVVGEAYKQFAKMVEKHKPEGGTA